MGGRTRLALAVRASGSASRRFLAPRISGGAGFTGIGKPVAASARTIVGEPEAQVGCTVGVMEPHPKPPVPGARQVAPSSLQRSMNGPMRTLFAVESENLPFHCYENVVVPPDGAVAGPGFCFGVTVLSRSGCAALAVGAALGIGGTTELSKVAPRGVLRIEGDGKGIERNAPSGGRGGPIAPKPRIAGGSRSGGTQTVAALA
jgi:hypothetical protein